MEGITRNLLPWAVTAAHVVPAILAAGHAILYRRDSRAALLWIGVIWFMPLLGAVLYWLFGLNRLRRRARVLRAGLDPMRTSAGVPPVSPGELADHLPTGEAHLVQLDRLVERVVDRPLLTGNRFEPLVDGERAYPEMIRAIRSAERSIALATYIFDRDKTGKEFVEELSLAVARGVEVRVLVDDTGARYSWPRIWGALRAGHVPHGSFNPRFKLLPRATLNLRNHRKILVTDGRIAFAGGMNIRDCHVGGPDRPPEVRDVHFRIEGPVVGQLMEVFAEDWLFTTGERLAGELWFPDVREAGPALARVIAEGPDEDLGKMSFSLRGALHTARRSIRIATPYFLPDDALISALNVAALRGVDVDIVIPEKGNIKLVRWATRAMLWQVLSHGVRIWFSPPPFDHSKLVVVDDCWTFFGSANWDHRSLRLNFEVDVEAYDPELARQVAGIFEERRQASDQVTLAVMDGRSLPSRLRDGMARLFTPFL